MKHIQGAAEDLKKLGAYLANLIDFAKELETVASFEQARNEAVVRMAAIKNEEQLAVQSLAAAKASVAAVELDIKHKSAEASDQAQQLIKAAELRSKSIIENAQNKFNEIMAPVEAQKAELDEVIAGLMIEQKKLKASVQEETEKLGALKAEIASLKAKLGI